MNEQDKIIILIGNHLRPYRDEPWWFIMQGILRAVDLELKHLPTSMADVEQHEDHIHNWIDYVGTIPQFSMKVICEKCGISKDDYLRKQQETH